LVSKYECESQKYTANNKECTFKVFLLSLTVLISGCKSRFYHLVAVWTQESSIILRNRNSPRKDHKWLPEKQAAGYKWQW